jgi:S1-C subfamily serine protease
MSEKLKLGFVVFVSMLLGAAGVVGIDALRSDGGGTTTVIERVQPSADGGVSNTTASTVADLYEQVRPSVVRVNASSGTSGGLGSGIVLDREGHILTNNHVVAGFSNIDVVLHNGTTSRAQLIGSDPGNDLAVIKINVPSDRLVPAKLGNSDDVRAGEFVIAVGNPFDLDGSITEGIVSGIGRTLSSGGGRPLRELIQSDAAINPGNSGGALFNGRGEVIGITTAIENPSGDRVFVGIGYAVPINTAHRFLPDMLAGRNIQHPRLGVQLRDLTPSLAQSLNIGVERGVIVQSVEPGSAAARAGLRGGASTGAANVGDVIVSIDGTTVNTFDELARLIDSKRVGDTVDVKVIRGGAEVNVPVTLEAWRG